ncbi:HD-containing protein [Coleophoma cylindrospora]|uniref:HD-containing protein n=1 Tax=Coleophoma cylindrospora TaxID=1849047 RepID=A0A3D8Q8B7_9HELO|nr:HD-containing protein [Coleophoma cylindrospora]
MVRPTISLDAHKDFIIKLFKEDNLPTEEIAIRINSEHGLDISDRTISRRLSEWNVLRKKDRGPPSQELQERIKYHYDRNLNDDEITEELKKEGFDLVRRKVQRVRQKLNLRRRSRFPGFGEDDMPTYENADAATSPPPKKTKPRPKKTASSVSLIPRVTAFAEQYMSKYDGSHDFNHIRRVVGLAHKIYTEIQKLPDMPKLDFQTITLAALLHDVGDKKYLEPGQDSSTLVLATLLEFGADEELAVKVQRIVLGVSYSSEIKDPAAVVDMIKRYPELAVVQDADRLDAIGAVGIGRTFTFGGAKNARDMGETIQHFEDKLEKLETMMKTPPGLRMARERTERLKVFKGWWADEQKEAEGLLRPK